MQSKNITQPPDWWDAFQNEADRAGISLSSWMGACCLNEMQSTKSGQAKVAKLSARPLASRPPKTKVEHVTYLPSQTKNGGAK